MQDYYNENGIWKLDISKKKCKINIMLVTNKQFESRLCHDNDK